jgi:hypothetical protein
MGCVNLLNALAKEQKCDTASRLAVTNGCDNNPNTFVCAGARFTLFQSAVVDRLETTSRRECLQGRQLQSLIYFLRLPRPPLLRKRPPNGGEMLQTTSTRPT